MTNQQYHKLLYLFMNGEMSEVTQKKEENPFANNPETFKITYRRKSGKVLMVYYHYPETEPDEYEGTDGSETGSIHMSTYLYGKLKKLVRSRQSKVMDIFADWFEETTGQKVTDVAIYD